MFTGNNCTKSIDFRITVSSGRPNTVGSYKNT